MQFVDWVRKHKGRETPMGDLAGDIDKDAKSIEDVIRDMQKHMACSEARKVFKRAVNRYIKYHLG